MTALTVWEVRRARYPDRARRPLVGRPPGAQVSRRFVTAVVEDQRVSGQQVIWSDGQPWRHLTEDAVAVGQVTVVSTSGATRLLDIKGRRHGRLPMEGGHVMRFDGQWLPLNVFELTPCGLVLEESSYWARGTPVRLVLAGLVLDWTLSPLGRATVDAVIARRRPVSPNHPPEMCPALYCPRRWCPTETA